MQNQNDRIKAAENTLNRAEKAVEELGIYGRKRGHRPAGAVSRQ